MNRSRRRSIHALSRFRMRKKTSAIPVAAALFACGVFSVFARAGTPPPDAENFEPPAPVVADAAGRTPELRLLAPFSRFARDSAPPEESAAAADVPALRVWRGETAVFRVGVWAGADALETIAPDGKILLKKDGGATLEAEVSPVRWTLGNGGAQFADVVDRAGTPASAPAGTLREFLVSVRVPEDAAAGAYSGVFRANLGGNAAATLPLRLRVLPATLPPPEKRAVHLDLWQHPQAVARWTGTPLWSREHFAALAPLMTRLRDLGQKAVTCGIIEEPWNHQTYDDWESMIKWTRAADGSWKFDYSAFDAWVEFMTDEIGIDEQISCYSMLPWSMKIGYFDDAAGTRKNFALDVASPSFEEIWGAFLTDFRKHLVQKGLLEKTCIALDERPDAQLDAARRVIEKFAPELKIVSANDHPTRMSDFVYDISPAFGYSGGDVPALAEKRRAEGRKTTFYVCVNPPRPNTFSHSAPAEARWLGLYAAANGFDGILRWAYNSWNENPFATTAFGNWPAGDCFLVYPGNRSSMRLEHFRDGLEDFEKIRILRSRAAEENAPRELKAAVATLDEFLKKNFTVENGGGNAHEAQALEALRLLDAASEKLPD